jgi:transcriptional regulator with XRE-family HTH domain
MSLDALAQAAGGMAKSYVAKLERGDVDNPGLQTLSSIAQALNVTVADLIDPAQPERPAAGRAVLDERAEFARLMENLPSGLKGFLDEMAAIRRPVPPETIRALAAIQFRGRRPERPEDWRFLYDALIRTVRTPQSAD